MENKNKSYLAPQCEEMIINIEFSILSTTSNIEQSGEEVETW